MSSTNSKNITLLVLLIIVITTTFIGSLIFYNIKSPIFTGINEVREDE